MLEQARGMVGRGAEVMNPPPLVDLLERSADALARRRFLIEARRPAAPLPRADPKPPGRQLDLGFSDPDATRPRKRRK
jgi:hypothetical protein